MKHAVRLSLSFLFLASVLSWSAPEAVAKAPGVFSRLDAHFGETLARVKATDDPARKRALLNASFQNMTSVLSKIERVPGLSSKNEQELADLRTEVRTKQLQLNGFEGQTRIPDAQLNDFAESAQQDFALENRSITISLTTALLILIILILLL